jgi:hypothetical protein
MSGVCLNKEHSDLPPFGQLGPTDLSDIVNWQIFHSNAITYQ